MTAHALHVGTGDRRLGSLALPAMGAAGVVGAAALLLSIVIAAAGEHGWERFFRSYLMAFMFITSISLGGLFFTMLQHAVRAGWSVTLRRLAECVASNLLWLWVLFIPIAVTVAMKSDVLYHWVHPGDDALLQHKSGYLNPAFWLIRAAVFLGIWAAIAAFYLRNSVAQDSDGDIARTYRMQRFAPLCLLLYALSQTFASMDWLMSLEPHWFSTMFPVYFFAGSCCGYFALQILIMFWLQRSGRVLGEITTEHYQDAGKLLFAFGIVFWAYIAFSQYMLIWYANIPEETPWYLARQVGGWQWISLTLLFGHFIVPFVGLISRHPKRTSAMLAIGAAWMLLMHLIDVYYLAMPRVPAELLHDAESYDALKRMVTPEDVGFGFHVLDLTCVIGMAGLLVAGTVWRMSRVSLVPEQDPRLHEAIAFENM